MLDWILDLLPGEIGADVAYWLSERGKRAGRPEKNISPTRKKLLERRAKDKRNRRLNRG